MTKDLLRGAAILGLLLSATPALSITNGQTPTDSRFDAVGAFAVTWRLGLDYTPKQPDAAPNAWFCTATLVTPQVVLLAAHCIEAYGVSAPYAVRFRTAPLTEANPASENLPTFHAFIASFVFAPDGTDTVYGILAEPVTHITPIPVSLSRPIPASVLQAGWGREGPGAGEGDATGLHICANAVWQVSGGWAQTGQPYGSGYGPVPNPCGVNSWDSGGPLLVEDAAGSLTVVAVTHSYTYSALVTSLPPATSPSLSPKGQRKGVR